MSDQAFPAAWGNPEQGGDYVSGMSLRDYMAGQWVASGRLGGVGPSEGAKLAYQFADAMLVARETQ